MTAYPVPVRADRRDFSVIDAIAELRTARADWRARQDEARDVISFPSRAALEQVVGQLSAALYPRRLGQFRGDAAAEDAFVAAKLLAAFTDLKREVAGELGYWQPEAGLFDADQAGTIVARLITELANERTGIDIHPGATIGPAFFIDHGTGVVIGETAIIGARVRLYQHVTLGARSPIGLTPHDVRERHARHPIVGDDVVIYAGATILGRVQVGARSTIGGNVWLLSDVAEDSVLVQPEAVRLDAEAGLALRDVLLHAASA